MKRAGVTPFSTRHPFTQNEVERAVEAALFESPRKRWLVSVTTAHRQNAIHQWILNQLAYWLTVPAIYLAEFGSPTVSRFTLNTWLAACAINWSIRAVLYGLIFRAPPDEVSRLLRLRLIPVLIMTISTGHWIWSVHLFVASTLTPTVLVIYIGFVMLAIAGIGNLLVTRIAAGAYVVTLWLALSLRAVATDLMPWPVVVAIDGCVAAILWLCVYMTVKRLQPHLERSDQVDLLMARLRHANTELEALKNEAAETLEKRSSFFAGASHDFKQRLHGIKLMLHSTITGLSSSDTSCWALTRMAEEVRELEGYIAHFLAFARIEALDEKATLQEVSLLTLFQEIDLRFEDVAMSSGVGLRIRATSVRLHTDGRLLLQMLENLVSNAVKFTAGDVVVAARRRGGDVVIEVWDQGPGIDPGQLSKIFDAFHQHPGAVDRGERGFGLGLAVVKRFAKRLDCTVTVSSKVGKGSVFTIRVPGSHVLATR